MLQKIRKNTLENLEKYSPKSGSHSQDHFSQLLPHCMDWVKIVKLLREPNRNEASQPYETFCTLSLHQNTPLGPKTPTTPTQEPPQKWNSWFCPVLDPCTEMASGNSCVFPTMQVDWMSHMHCHIALDCPIDIIVLAWYLHQPESHQLNFQKGNSLSDNSDSQPDP